MNGKTFQVSLLSLAAVVMLASLLTSPAAAGGNPKASGHGNWDIEGDLRTFSFTAVEHADGTVKGEAELNNRSYPVRLHWKNDCLKFEGGNRAIVSGWITESSIPELVGLPIVFGVEDNGEGRKADPDRITGADLLPEATDCNDVTFGDFVDQDGNQQTGLFVGDTRIQGDPLTPIEGGNIQVKP